MAKVFRTYAVLVLTLLGMSSPAYADIEALQGAVLGPIQSAMQEVKSIQEQLTELQSELRSAAEGISGAVKDVKAKVAEVQGMVSEVQGAIADPQGALSSMGSKMPGFLAELDVNDQEVLQGAIKENYFGQFSKANLSSIKDTVKNSTSALKSKVESSIGEVSDVSKTVSAASANLKNSVSNVALPQAAKSLQPVQSTAGVTMTSQAVKENLLVSGLNSMKQASSASSRAVSAAPVPAQMSTPMSVERLNISEQAVMPSAPTTSTGKVINRQAFGTAKQAAPLTKATQGLQAISASAPVISNSAVANNISGLESIAQRPQSTLQAVEGMSASSEKAVAARADLESLKADKLQSKSEAMLTKETAKVEAQALKAEAKEAAKAEIQSSKAGLSSLKDNIAQSKAAVSQAQERLNTSAKEKSSELQGKLDAVKAETQAVKANATAVKVDVKAIQSEAKPINTNGVSLQKAIISKEPQSLGKGAWLNEAETIKVSVYKISETLAFGAEDSTAAETDSTRIAQEQAEKMAAIQRESFASLYAQAFTIRTNLFKEKEEEKSKENSRDIIQATKDKALVMSKRLRRIMIMNAGLYNFKMSQLATQFSVQGNEEEDDE